MSIFMRMLRKGKCQMPVFSIMSKFCQNYFGGHSLFDLSLSSHFQMNLSRGIVRDDVLTNVIEMVGMYFTMDTMKREG